MNPKKYIFEKPVTSDRLAKWQMILFGKNMTYFMSLRRRGFSDWIKADRLADQSLDEYSPVNTKFQMREYYLPWKKMTADGILAFLFTFLEPPMLKEQELARYWYPKQGHNIPSLPS